jgi:DNA invertase Pin-like site-specific DNA recombinase
MKIGYARVSTAEQNLDLQRQALSAAGCAVIFEDKGISGAAVDRPGPADALAALESGGALVVWRLDRLGMPNLNSGFRTDGEHDSLRCCFHWRIWRLFLGIGSFVVPRLPACCP